MSHSCYLYACLCVHGRAETLDGVAELPNTQTAQQTDVSETNLWTQKFTRPVHDISESKEEYGGNRGGKRAVLRLRNRR